MRRLLTRWIPHFGAAALLVAVPTAHAQQAHVAVTVVVKSATFDAIYNGLRDGLRDRGFADGANLQLTYDSADANPVQAARDARRIAADAPDAVVAISVPSALAVVREAALSAIVFAVAGESLPLEVREAVAARRAIGLTTATPAAETLDVIHEIVPDARALGLLYPAGSGELIARLRRLAHRRGLRVIAPFSATAQTAEDVDALIARQVDAMLMLPGIQPELDAIVARAEAAMVPVFAFDAESVAGGAVAALMHEPYETGRQAAELVIRVLAGEAVSNAVTPAVATRLIINPDAAERMGVKIPQAAIDRARLIFD